MQQRLRAAPSIKKRAKGVYLERNLGTIKDRKREKKEEEVVGDGEIIMRILWMRYVFHYSNLGFFCSVPTLIPLAPPPDTADRICPTSSRNNCRSWRRCRPSRNSDSSRIGRPGGQAAQPASQMYYCEPAVPEIPLEEGSNTNSSFPFHH
jgi:hypothetical protein